MVLNGYQYSCYNLSQYASQTPRSKIKSSPRQPPPTSGEAVDLSTVEAPPVTRCWQIGRSSMGNEMKWDQKREHLQNNEEEIIFPKSGKRTSAIQRGTWDDPLQGLVLQIHRALRSTSKFSLCTPNLAIVRTITPSEGVHKNGHMEVSWNGGYL